MEITGEDPNEGQPTQSIGNHPGGGSMPEFRRDLAFPKLTEEMIQRLIPYGREEAFAADAVLYTFGDRGTALGQFQLPTGLFIDHNDRIYVVDSFNRRVQIFHFYGLGKQAKGGVQ